MPERSDSPPDWQTLDRALSELLALDRDEQRQRLKALWCKQPHMATRLERMLAAALGDEPPFGLAESTIGREAFLTSHAPDQLGPWTLLRCVGSGGMADVYEATRDIGDSQQRAAIKLLRGGIGTAWMRERFDQETGILARLEDPRLARLFDAGVVDDGRPWLAMEYVDGQPIDEACDQVKLSLPSRVRLLVEVCGAVAHAHQHLIVHRDLKPSNILIDREGRVRLLDFGIAALSGSGPERDPQASEKRSYTLCYASPEQLRGQRTGPATDVFQLGLVAYILLTGGSPYPEPISKVQERLDDIEHGPRPAGRTCLDMQPAMAAARSCSARCLARQCRGDLDAILSRALAPEPQARYESASAMGEDLQRWLSRRPVHARPLNWSYRARRFVARNWIATTGGLLLVSGLAAFLVLSLLHNRELTLERDLARAAQQRSESLHRFVLDVFGSVDPNLQESRGQTVDELVKAGLQRIDDEFAAQPELAAQLTLDMAGLLLRRSKLTEAIAAYRRGIKLRDLVFAPDDEQRLLFWTDLIYALDDNGDYASADALSLEHLDRVRSVVGTGHQLYVEALLARARAVSSHQSREASIPYLEEIRHLKDRLQDVEARELRLIDAHWTNQLGSAYAEAQRWEDAEPLLARALDMFEAEFGTDDGRTQLVRMNYAFALRGQGRLDEARAAMERLLAIQHDFYDHANWRVAYTLAHLASISSDQGHYDEAVNFWQQAVDGMHEAVAEDHPQTLRFMMAQARDLLRGGRCEQGRSMLENLSARDDLTENTERNIQEALTTIPCPAEATRGAPD